MDGHNKIQRHKRRLERNGRVKVIVGKWWNEASLSSTFNYFKIAIKSSCTNPGPHEKINYPSLQPRTKPVKAHYKNTYFFTLVMTKILTITN